MSEIVPVMICIITERIRKCRQGGGASLLSLADTRSYELYHMKNFQVKTPVILNILITDYQIPLSHFQVLSQLADSHPCAV